MNRRGFLAKCLGAVVAMAVAPLEPLLPKVVKELPLYKMGTRRLSQQEWTEYDPVVLRAAKRRMRAWAEAFRRNEMA